VIKPRLAVLISGNGSNLQALIDHTQTGRLPAEIALVISNRAEAFGLQRAASANIPHRLLASQGIAREAYDSTLIAALQAAQVDWIVLAGFMRILTPAFIQTFAGRIINIHPSLLPAYKGLHTHQRVLADQQTQHGCSVHVVTAELDDGPILAQAKIDIAYPNTEQQLAAQVHQLEHQLYPLTLFGLCTQQCYDADHQGWQPVAGSYSSHQAIFAQTLSATSLQQVFQTWLNSALHY
jgi:phosphoribosylglycinamide formyltransferase-1